MSWKLFPLKVLVVAVLIFSFCINASFCSPGIFELEIECREGRHYIYTSFDASTVEEVESPTFNLSEHVEMAAYIERYICPIHPILLADQRFRSRYPNWQDVTYAWVERADDELYRKFEIDVDASVADYVAYESTTNVPGERLNEAIEVAWTVRSQYEFIRTVVIAFTTGEHMGDLVGIADNRSAAILIRPLVYWADDNALMHELSHLYFAHDHFEGDPNYKADCIMSYEKVWVEFVLEDGGIWWVHRAVEKIFVTKNYCSLCYTTVYLNAIRFNPPTMHGGRYRI
jgi:hypothetical protein